MQGSWVPAPAWPGRPRLCSPLPGFDSVSIRSTSYRRALPLITSSYGTWPCCYTVRKVTPPLLSNPNMASAVIRPEPGELLKETEQQKGTDHGGLLLPTPPGIDSFPADRHIRQPLSSAREPLPAWLTEDHATINSRWGEIPRRANDGENARLSAHSALVN